MHVVLDGERLSEGQCGKSRGRTQVFLQGRESLNFNPKDVGGSQKHFNLGNGRVKLIF